MYFFFRIFKNFKIFPINILSDENFFDGMMLFSKDQFYFLLFNILGETFFFSENSFQKFFFASQTFLNYFFVFKKYFRKIIFNTNN